MIVETQSFALDARDAMYNIVTASPYFAGYTFRKTKMLPVQVNLIPYLGVYIADETMVPDGDPNVGMIRFNHTARIGFSIINAGNDPAPLERANDAAFLQIMSLLWTDLQLMNFLQNANPEGVGIEAVIRGTRRHLFGATGTNNETPFAELQYEVNLFSRSEWWPDITDTFDMITSQTQFKSDHDGQTTSVQQVELVVDYTQPDTPPFPADMPDPIPGGVSNKGVTDGSDQPDSTKEPPHSAEREEGE